MNANKASLQIILAVFGLGILSACGGQAPAAGTQLDVASSQESAENPGGTGLRTATPASIEPASAGDTDPDRWARAASFRGTFSFTLERDLEEADALMGGSQTVRSTRSATGTITLQRTDEDTFHGEGTVTWSVDDAIEVRDENGEFIRTATASGEGETDLDPEQTVLWLDPEMGTYGLAIFPSGLYDEMEVHATETIVGLAPTDEQGPLGYLGLMDTAGIAGWVEELPLPATGLDLGGILELPDGSTLIWTLEPGS